MGAELSARGSRVELNAMTSRQFIDFLELKFDEHEVEKVIPDNAVMIRHARRVIEEILAEKALEERKESIAKKAAETELPQDLQQLVEREIEDDPSLPWDIAVAKVVTELDDPEENSP